MTILTDSWMRSAIVAFLAATSLAMQSSQAGAVVASVAQPTKAALGVQYNHTPPRAIAVIFNNIGPTADILLTDGLALQRYGYEFTYDTVKIGAGSVNANTATLADFERIAQLQPGILIIDTHGVPDLRSATASHTMGLVVQYFNDTKSAQAFWNSSAAKTEYAKGWIAPASASIGTINSRDVLKEAVAVTVAGIKQYLGGIQMGLVVDAACDSSPLSIDFKAWTYLGYPSPACPANVISDIQGLFNGLEGNDGPGHRNTFSAPKGGLALAMPASPVTLAPAVAYVYPGENASISPAQSTRVEVYFDTAMAAGGASSLVQASGCDAAVQHASWANDNTLLTFELKLPPKPSSTSLTLRIDPARATGGAEGAAIELDGNQDPAGTSGVFPNRDPYEWHLSCGSALDLYFSGTVFGHTLKGYMLDASSSPAQIMCSPITSGAVNTGAVNHINGYIPSNTGLVEAGIEADDRYGTSTIPKQAIATFDWFHPYTHIGATSGTVTITQGGGSIDAVFSYGGGPVTVRGSWTCPKSGT